MSIGIKIQKNRLRTTINNAGPRYTSALNVGVNITEVFDGFGRTFEYYDTLKTYFFEFTNAYRSTDQKKVTELIGSQFNKVVSSSAKVSKIIEKIPNSGGKVVLPFDKLVSLCTEVEKNLQDCFEILRKKKDEFNAMKKNKKPSEYDRLEREPFSDESNYLNGLYSKLSSLKYFLQGRVSQAANNRFIILRGEAGSGKTHFLCDLSKRRIKNGLPTFIFLGEEFNNSDPWKTILKKLSLNCSIKQFLQSLDSMARNKNSRAFIIIDAVNEQQTKVVWIKLLNQLKEYKSICLILSVRTGFEFSVLPANIRRQALDVIHEGFNEREWDALTNFFNFYNLELPDVPQLFPDFNNPLFLKIYCETYKDKGGSSSLKGHSGFTGIFEDYIIAQGKKILKDLKNNNPKTSLFVWNKTIKQVASYMAKNRVSSIPESEVFNITKLVFPTKYKKYAQLLEKYGLLLKKPIYDSENYNKVTGFEYTFPYQRFSDHLIIRNLLSDSSSIANPKSLFTKEGSLNYILKDHWKFRGLLEALAIQVPERFKGQELILLLPSKLRDNHNIQDSFLQSLIWRDISIKKKSLKAFKVKQVLNIINNIILKPSGEYNDVGYHDILEVMLTVSAVPNHPLNAHFLHPHLLKDSLPVRDNYWLPFLHEKFDSNSAVDRIIYWALRVGEQTNYKKESIQLIAITLVWFLASSNRYLRDSSTKALVNLLSNNLEVLLEILKMFEKVNDPYIQERLFAVAYGCSLRSRDKKLKEIGIYVYRLLFFRRRPPTHILLRDYARGVVETTLKKFPSIKKDINEQFIKPPYVSSWPKKIPSLSHLKKKYYNEKVVGKTKYPYGGIWHSLMHHNKSFIADFGNYTVGSTLSHWSKKRIRKDGSLPKSLTQLKKEFEDNLREEQKSLFDAYMSYRRKFYAISFMPILPFKKGSTRKTSDKKIKQFSRANDRLKKEFEKSLANGQKKRFLKLYDNQNSSRRLDGIDAAKVERLIFDKIIKLGWRPKRFYKFDSNINERTRSPNKAERIGKKYQWIAFHDVLGRIADNFVFKDGWNDSYTLYKGPWQTSRRDIDPSHNAPVSEGGEGADLWPRVTYRQWKLSKKHADWAKVKDVSKIPRDLLEIKYQGRKWLVLDGYCKWREPKKPGTSKVYSEENREVWAKVRSYIIKKEQAADFFSWAKKQNFIGGWLKEPVNFYDIFYREYPYSTAYQSIYGSDQEQWTTIENKDRSETPFKVLVTTEGYTNEANGYDCSIKETISISLPCVEIMNGLSLDHGNKIGQFINKKGKLVVQAPYTGYDANDFVLVDKQEMNKFLKLNGYVLVWAVMGEKIILSMGSYYGRMDFGGAYMLDNKNGIKGKSYCEYIKPHR